MADENTQPATPASKGKAAKNEMVLLRLVSASANDEFRIGDGVITNQGVEVPVEVAEEMLVIGAQHGVHMSYGPIENKE